MSERIADPSVVCPFVAFDDDRDFRAPVPDHRHRCFAENPAAPRALAHQAAYCLSASFAGCPTFVDWARREAAPPKSESPVRSLRGPAGAPRAASGPPPTPGAPVEIDSSTGRPAEPAPRRESDWTAPPPWAGAAGLAAGAAAAGRVPRDDVGDEAYSASGDLVPGSTPAAGAGLPDDLARPPAPPPDARSAPPPPPADAPAFLAGRSSRPAAPPPAYQDDEPWDAGDTADERYEEPPSRPAVAAPRRMPVGYAPVAAGSERVAGGSRRERSDPAAPSWEQPRRSEAYPTLKSRGGGGIPRPALYALVVLLVGVALFATPALLRGLGGGGDGASPTPAASASVVPTVQPSPTPVPSPEQVVHTVKSGDTLSKIAAQYGVTVDQILEANPSIKNPNSIAIGDQIVIPQPLPSEIVNSEITPAP